MRDGTVSHLFSMSSPDSNTIDADEALKSIGRISLSGAQPKFSVVVENGLLRYAIINMIRLVTKIVRK